MSNVPSSVPSVGHNSISDSLFAAFIGPKAPYYMSHFAKFRAVGDARFTTSWNWAGFLVPYAWLFYRKMYLFGVIALIASCVFNFIGWLVSGIAIGLCGNYLYYTHATKKLLTLQASTPEKDCLLMAQASGGTNMVAVWVVVIANILVFLLLVGAPLVALSSLGLF